MFSQGLDATITEICPESEHRFCAYHIYNNYSKHFRGNELKQFFWRCTKLTTMPEFERHMANLKGFNIKAWEYLSNIPPKQWSRAAFDTISKSQVITNNMCEQFNAKIVAARGEPIISMLEEIRIYIMKKITTQRSLLERIRGPLCPRVKEKLEENKRIRMIWIP